MTTVLLKLFRKKNELSRRQFIAFLLYIIIPIVSMLIQMFFYGILFIVIGTVISSIILFASIVISQINAYIDEKALNEVYLTDILLLQMRPHFIYNTMSSIYYLCDLDPKKAQTVVRDFSIYLKKNFSAVSKRELIPFTDELEHTRAYLAIEKARYEKLLFVEYDIQNMNFHLPMTFSTCCLPTLMTKRKWLCRSL
jgi:LytS/YehU family sensor histidine kinase